MDRSAWSWEQAVVSWIFPRQCNLWQQWHCHSPHRITANHPDSRKWLPHLTWRLRHPLESLVCTLWPGTHFYTWGKCSSRWPPVDQWCCCTSYGPTACTASTRWRCCRHPCSRQHRNTGLISLGRPSQHRIPWPWYSSCWHRALYIPHQSPMPWALRYIPPPCRTMANCISSMFNIWWMEESSTHSNSFIA